MTKFLTNKLRFSSKLLILSSKIIKGVLSFNKYNFSHIVQNNNCFANHETATFRILKFCVIISRLFLTALWLEKSDMAGENRMNRLLWIFWYKFCRSKVNSWRIWEEPPCHQDWHARDNVEFCMRARKVNDGPFSLISKAFRVFLLKKQQLFCKRQYQQRLHTFHIIIENFRNYTR